MTTDSSDYWFDQRYAAAEFAACECSDPFTASLTGHGHACPLYDEED